MICSAVQAQVVVPRESVKPAGRLAIAPTAARFNSLPLSKVEKQGTKELQLDVLRREDAAALKGANPWRFAVPQSVKITPFTGGTWENLNQKTQVWRLLIDAGNAPHVNFGFTRYHMPRSGQLYIYSADQTSAIRPFTHEDNADHGQLWTPIIPSSQVVIELTIDQSEMHLLDLELGSINVGYRGYGLVDLTMADTPSPRSGSCNLDVVCSIADPWDLQIPGVSVLQISGSLNCTSFMVNNTAQDLKPYLMTANHCGVSAGTAATVVAYWNYQNSTCRTPGSPASGGPGDGTLTQFNSGSTFRAASAASDFTLVELTSSPNPAWAVSWLGWDRTGANPPDGACIHHPNTDEKRITFYNSITHPSHGSSWPCSANPGPGDNSHIRVYWDPTPTPPQVTEGGSSGSPLFDNNKRVIGQLHGGPSACGSTGDNLSDCYGRVSVSWTGGGTNATRLSNWLDPLNTGVMNLDTISGAGMTVVPSANVLSEGVVGGPFTNNSTTYTLTNPTTTPINYQVSLAIDFGVLINGSNVPISGSLAPLGGSTTITVTLGPAINSLPAGVYVESVNFDDLTNSRTTTRQHTVEIGQTAFTTTPATGLTSDVPVGGPFPDTVTYTLTSTKPTAVGVQVSVDQPWLQVNGVPGPVTINLPSNGSTGTATIAYSAAATSLPAGVYSGTITFTNLAGGAGSTTRPVSLSVGLADFTTTPAGGFTTGGPVGGPFPGTQVYTLTSVRPSSVSIQVSANQPWVTINGGPGPVTVNLGGTGSNAGVTIGIGAAANSLPAGLNNATVSFTNLTTPPAGNTTRAITLDVGRFTYVSTDVPKPIADNASVSSTLTIPDGYCVGDIQLDLGITHTYVGDLSIKLAHNATTVTVINRPTNGPGGGACSGDNYNVRLEDTGTGGAINTLCGSPSVPTSPPSYTPLNPLAGFAGQVVGGVWTLTVTDNANLDTGSLTAWSLRIAASGAVCPPIATNMSVNVADSVTTPINLDISSSLPASLNAMILSLPANGTLKDPNGGNITSVPYTLLANGKIVNFKPNSYFVGPTSFTFKGNDGQDSNTATCNIQVGLNQVIYDFPLDSDPGWTADPAWAFGTPLGGGSAGKLDPTSGFTGVNVYGYNLAGEYPNSLTPTRWLTTTPLNLAGVTNTRVEFRRWLGVESSTFDHAYVDVSNNGTTWTNLYSNPASSFSEQAWSLQGYGISAVADNQAAVRIRWGMGTTDGSVTYQGWNIDDIQIKGLRAPVLGDINNDGVHNATDTGFFINVLLGLDTDPLHVSRTDVNIDGVADGKDVQTYVGLP